MNAAFDPLLTALLGIAVGLTELLSRYRAAPGRALKSLPSLGYLLVNGGAALAALYLIRTLGWTFMINEGSSAPGTTQGTATPTITAQAPSATTATQLQVADQQRLLQVLTAGLGSMALLRSVVIVSANPNQEKTSWRPGAALGTLLSTIDGQVGRRVAAQRIAEIGEIMRGVSYSKAAVPLPATCIGFMENFPADGVTDLLNQVDALNKLEVPDATKALLLGAKLTPYVGAEMLERAVASLGDDIRDSPSQTRPP